MKPKYRTITDVASELGVQVWNLSRWLNGKARPRLHEAERLAGCVKGTTLIMWLRPDTKALKKALRIK